MLLLRSTLSSNTRASTDDAGAGVPVPFGCIVTSDNWISTGSSSSESSSPASFRSALRSFRSAWLTLHAVKRRFIHPIFFSLAPLPVPWSCRCFAPMSVWQSRLPSPLTCSSLVTSPASSHPLFLSGMESVSAGSVQAITGAIFCRTPLRRALQI